MSLNLVSSWIFVEKRRLIQVFPEPVRRLWDEWELRVMVLLSLFLQISLISLGNKRKYSASNWIRIFLWCAYLMADWVATVALGVLVNRQGGSFRCGIVDNGNPGRDELTAFWAPFLLLHLGGPDTITAYALADNELWIRHLLGLIVQTVVALNISLLAWRSTSWLSYLTLPMLLAGTIKYVERSLSLRYANRDQFRDSVLSRRDPGPSYAKFMEEFRLKLAEGYHVTADEVLEVNVPADDMETVIVSDGSPLDAIILPKAHSFFENFKRLFVDLILSFHHRDESRSFFQKHGCKTAFTVIEIELGFAYDVFYTKAPVNYTCWGFFFRFITSCFTFLVFMAFLYTIGFNLLKHSPVDLVITYILLGGAIGLEVSAVISLVSSDWTKLWLNEHSKTPLFKAISNLKFYQKYKIRWSKSMNQYNLLRFCLKQVDPPAIFPRIIPKLVPLPNQLQILVENLREKLENVYQLNDRAQIPCHLEDSIFEHFLEKSKTDKEATSLCICRGGCVLEKSGHLEIKWTTEVEFDHSILLWHIATHLCYSCYSLDVGEISSDCEEPRKQLVYNILHSKQLANYMLYLLVECPFMLPIGIGLIRFRDTCAEAIEFFKDKSLKSDEEACKMLTQVSTEVAPTKVKGDRSKSVLFEACMLANLLQQIEDKNKMWEIVSNVWVEILGYAASHCRGYYHAQQLQKGGEFLTHVWLLMAHLGITEHFQISRGHARAKLAVK